MANKFALPNSNNATSSGEITLNNTTGYGVYSDVSVGVPVAQQTVPVTPGVPVVEGNGIETGLNRSEQVTQLPGFPINVGTST